MDLYFAKLVASMYLGRYSTDYLGKKKVSVYASFTLGLTLYYLISVIPYVGPAVRVIAFFVGLGAIYTVIWEWIKKEKTKKK